MENKLKAAEMYEEMAAILRHVDGLEKELNTPNANVINREAKEETKQKLKEKFNQLSLTSLFFSDL